MTHSKLCEIRKSDYFAINIFNSLMANASYQVIDKKNLIKEAVELAEYMSELTQKKKQSVCNDSGDKNE